MTPIPHKGEAERGESLYEGVVERGKIHGADRDGQEVDEEWGELDETMIHFLVCLISAKSLRHCGFLHVRRSSEATR